MCGTCGCAEAGHEHREGHAHGRTVALEVDLLAKNDGLAAANREWFARRGIVALNLMSSPGAGKTTLLERTVRELDLPVSVLEGDQETVLDADRIAAAAEQAAEGTDPPGDLNATPDYKRHLARVLTRRALEKAAAG